MHIVTYRADRCSWPLAIPPHVTPIPWAMPKALDVHGRWPSRNVMRCYGITSKHCDGYFRFQCPHCDKQRARVNPKNNLAHCFSCGENINNIDLLMILGFDFLPAVTIPMRPLS